MITRHGLPVYESEIQGQKLGWRDIFVTHNGEQQKMPMDTLRAQFYAGLLPADAHVLVTKFYCEKTCFCGEGSVGSVVAAWESAPLEEFDHQDIARMILEFSFPEYEVASKATYNDLTRLYERCDSYYRYIEGCSREFKRLTKAATKDLVFQLDETQPGWDGTDATKRFAEEVRRHHPQLIRSEAEKKAKRERDKEKRIEREERRPLIETRNSLTFFPHKSMQVETQDHGMVEIRAIKAKLREGTLIPETLVRYRSDADWMELCDFVKDWTRNKATKTQIDYLKALHRRNGISTEIPLDISRQEISDRISALAPKLDDD